MQPCILSVLFFTALTVTAIPAPQQAGSQVAHISPKPVDLGSDISFTNFLPLDGATETYPPIILPMSSSSYNISYTKYSGASSPPAENYPAALLFISRFYKDQFLNLASPTPESLLGGPVDVTTADVHFQFQNHGPPLSYNLFFDLLADIAYFSLTWQREITTFELLNRGSPNEGAVAYSGSVTAAAGPIP